MQKVNFEDGLKISGAKVVIDEHEYPVTPAVYSGTTPLSAYLLNKMQQYVEDAIEGVELAAYPSGVTVYYDDDPPIYEIDLPENFETTYKKLIVEYSTKSGAGKKWIYKQEISLNDPFQSSSNLVFKLVGIGTQSANFQIYTMNATLNFNTHKLILNMSSLFQINDDGTITTKSSAGSGIYVFRVLGFK